MNTTSINLIRGAAIAYVLIFMYLARKAGKDGKPGILCFGVWLWFMAISCLILTVSMLVYIFIVDNTKDLWMLISLCVMFSTGALYCFSEAAYVRGHFDKTEIKFKTPWAKSKQEKWKDIVNIDWNKKWGWYTLTFRSGNKIRLSRFLNGHKAALKIANGTRKL